VAYESVKRPDPQQSSGHEATSKRCKKHKKFDRKIKEFIPSGILSKEKSMNNTTRRYARTLSEAFPHDADQSYAIYITGKKPMYALHWITYGAICMYIGYVFGRYL
jgi:hypothetical protein